MVAITAVKNTVAPIPTYLLCSPLEQFSKIFLFLPKEKLLEMTL